MPQNILESIKEAVNNGRLKEPFTPQDVKRISPGKVDKTYNSFLVHHRKGNPIKFPEYFERGKDGTYKLLKRR
ncbi:MAG: hypothetical protein V3U49_07825 [Nitrososphaerales archaeon]